MGTLTNEQAIVAATLLRQKIWQINGKWYREMSVEERAKLVRGDTCLIGRNSTTLSWDDNPPNNLLTRTVDRYDPVDYSVKVMEPTVDYYDKVDNSVRVTETTNYRRNMWINVGETDYEKIVVEL
jgi:hypothetical protein